MRDVRPEAIREHGAIRFRSEYHYAVFEYYRSAKIVLQLERAGVRVGGRILDAGCGGGGVAVSLAEEAELAVGIDIRDRFSEAGRRLARERGIDNASFLVADGMALPFRDGSFDLVLSHSVIEHVRSATAYLRECYRVLRPGGVLFLSTPPYRSFAGSHLSRLRLPVPLHLLLPRRWAFRLNFFIARRFPLLLKEPLESNSLKMLAARGETKQDDLLQRVSVEGVHRWIAEAGFELLREDRHVSGFFARLPESLRRRLEASPWTQNIVVGNLELVLARPAHGPAGSDEGLRRGVAAAEAERR